MQSGQDCLIYHMLGNSLRRLHVSRTKIGSLLTEWFAARLWAELAFKPFSSPEHPPNTSFLRCALLFPSSIEVTTKIFNRWKVNESKVQTVVTLTAETEGQGESRVRTWSEKTLLCVKTEWERSYLGLSEMLSFAVCLSLLQISDSVRKENY